MSAFLIKIQLNRLSHKNIASSTAKIQPLKNQSAMKTTSFSLLFIVATFCLITVLQVQSVPTDTNVKEKTTTDSVPLDKNMVRYHLHIY